ncbi:hypothetical protein [Macrococcus lamae]|uniref:DUF1146 domain-containing protein n=1 Tax=Macrococcus lamae TaxID=198484 RepID=A0A4R6BW04_9STAP|nr:hypothetical protein [Macrococcus lamae]TDM12200.1 hypothetical protein ERX29_03805 [Macrococcus lamae]
MIISLLLLIGLCIWIYYCNQQVQRFLERDNINKALIWLYLTMITSVIIVGFLMFSLREQVLDVLNVFYRH